MKKRLYYTLTTGIMFLALGLSTAPAFAAVNILNGDPSTPNDPGVCNNAHATSTPSVCGASPSSNPIVGNGGILGLVITVLSVVVGIIAVISIIISGVRMITSAGDSNSVASARRAILYSIVALVIAVLSRIIVSITINHTAT